jgi:hypothetical protein
MILINCVHSEKARNDLRQLGYLKDTAPIISSTLKAESKEPVVGKAESKDTVTGSGYGWMGTQSVVSKAESKDPLSEKGSVTGSGYGWMGSQSVVSKAESKDPLSEKGSVTGSGYGWMGTQSVVSKAESKDPLSEKGSVTGSETGSMGSVGDKGLPIDGGKDGESGDGPPGPVIGETPAEREAGLRAASPSRKIYLAMKRKVMSLFESTIPYKERSAAYEVRTNEQATEFRKKFSTLYAMKVKERADEGPEDKRRRQRRLLFFSAILYFYFLFKMYGQKAKDYITDEFVEVVKIILEKESLKETITSLAVGIIHALLQDAEVAATAAAFLRDAAAVPETQNALVGLTIHVLQHPDTIREFSLLIKNLIDVLVNDKV